MTDKIPFKVLDQVMVSIEKVQNVLDITRDEVELFLEHAMPQIRDMLAQELEDKLVNSDGDFDKSERGRLRYVGDEQGMVRDTKIGLGVGYDRAIRCLRTGDPDMERSVQEEEVKEAAQRLLAILDELDAREEGR